MKFGEIMVAQKEKKMSDNGHMKQIRELFNAHEEVAGPFDRHANTHLYRHVAKADDSGKIEEHTIGQLLEDEKFQKPLQKLLDIYLGKAGIGKEARKYLTDMTLSDSEIKTLFAGRMGNVYTENEAAELKEELLRKIRTKVTQGVDNSLSNIRDPKKLRSALEYVVDRAEMQ